MKHEYVFNVEISHTWTQEESLSITIKSEGNEEDAYSRAKEDIHFLTNSDKDKAKHNGTDIDDISLVSSSDKEAQINYVCKETLSLFANGEA